MHLQFPLWDFIRRSMAEEKPVMLLYVLQSKGSSPGRQGFGMAVNAGGDMCGSIGGGIMEHKFVEKVKSILEKGETSYSELVIQYHDKQAANNQSGMICSGEQINFLYKLKEADFATVFEMAESLLHDHNGTLTMSPEGIAFSGDIPEQNFSFEIREEADWQYIEKTGYKYQLYIAGGGHCSLALSRIMCGMDFRIHVFDERKNLNTMEQNSYAHRKQEIADYKQLEALIPGGESNYVVLMTFGYRTDDIAIRALLQKDFGFFGVLGSQSKIKKMFSDYIAEGISEERLKRIHAPIGLPIHSQTPDEIAVSIAAQIIMVKNGGVNESLSQ